MAVKYGVDYAYGSGVTTAQLKAHGADFVVRYLSWEPNTKNIDGAELKNLLKAGIDVVLNWESNGTMPGYAQGKADAREALRQAVALGHPHAVIYFSLDVDPHAVNMASVFAYLDGAASVIGRKRVGIYGGYLAVHAALSNGKAHYGWQTYAWSGGLRDPRAHIFQHENSVPLGPATVDLDVTNGAADFGQLQVGQPAPKPGPIVVADVKADGTESLRDVAAKVKLPISTVLRYTLETSHGHTKLFSAAMSAYLQGADLTKPLPKGERIRIVKP